MAFIKRYSAIKKGGIIFTGNTLGLSKLSNLNRAGLQGSIGAFTSLNTSLRVNDFPFGTTLNYLQNGSAATLQLPPGSNVIYAELIWGGLYRSSVSNISNIINNAVTFTTPLTSVSVTGDGVTAQNFEIPLQDITVGFYVRTAIVTPYITAGGSGTYSLSAVPALIDPINNNTNDTNHAGWTLAVVYENQNESFKSLNLWTGGTVVSPFTGVTDITLSGFKTPSTPSPSGKIYVSAQEGDAVISGDQMYFGQNALTLLNLSGPNNPQNNFFCSQINGSDGLVDTSGTFGTRNANALTSTNISAGRQGYDITTVDLTGKLSPEQSSAFIRFISTGDLYVPNAIAIAIDNGENPNLATLKSTDKSVAVKGDILTYVSVLTNTGSLPLENVIFTDAIPAGTQFVPGSVTVDGVPFPAADPSVGFTVSNMAPTQSVTVIFKVTVL